MRNLKKVIKKTNLIGPITLVGIRSQSRFRTACAIGPAFKAIDIAGLAVQPCVVFNRTLTSILIITARVDGLTCSCEVGSIVHVRRGRRSDSRIFTTYAEDEAGKTPEIKPEQRWIFIRVAQRDRAPTLNQTNLKHIPIDLVIERFQFKCEKKIEHMITFANSGSPKSIA